MFYQLFFSLFFLGKVNVKVYADLLLLFFEDFIVFFMITISKKKGKNEKQT